MNRKPIFLKMMSFAVMAAAVSVFAACGSSNDSSKAYLDEINLKNYVKLGEYKGLEVTQAEPEVLDEEKDSYINYLLSMNPAEGVKEGDTVNIDYVGTLDGVAFDGGTASGANLTIGSGQYIEGFESGLVGAKAGDTVELDLTFPENYQSKELAGKSVVFTVTINTIMAATPQELTEEYVQGLDIEAGTVEEYKQYVYDMLYEDAVNRYELNIENILAGIILENSEFTKEPPQGMIDRYTETLTTNLTREAAGYGITLGEYMQYYYGMDAESYQEEIQNQALLSAKQYIVLKAIADEEGITVTKEELQAELERMADEAAYESVDEFKKAIDDKGYKEFMIAQKAMEMLRENAVITAE